MAIQCWCPTGWKQSVKANRSIIGSAPDSSCEVGQIDMQTVEFFFKDVPPGSYTVQLHDGTDTVDLAYTITSSGSGTTFENEGPWEVTADQAIPG